jgi:hypothetical protein
VVSYWQLENKDTGMQKFAKERTELILNETTKLIEKYCKGSYQDTYTKDQQPLFYKSDQRIDFMINLYYEIIKQFSSKLSELENERDRRL